jgi:hypothetical protein
MAGQNEGETSKSYFSKAKLHNSVIAASGLEDYSEKHPDSRRSLDVIKEHQIFAQPARQESIAVSV